MPASVHEPVSPELVLVSPPDAAERARLELPDYEREFGEWLARTRAAFEAAHGAQNAKRHRIERGTVLFTAVMALNSIAALLLVVVGAR